MKLVLISSILALSFIMLGFDSFKLSNNLKNPAALESFNVSIADTIPVKSEDPMQQFFDAVDKMERMLEGMGKQPSTFKPDQDSLVQQQDVIENVELDTLM